MSEFSDRVKEQMEQLNSSVDQVKSAYRGLYVKIKEEGNKQFDELVKTGKAQAEAEESFLTQLKTDISAPFDDVKSTMDQLKNAYVGFVVKAVNSSEQVFDELVELGSSKISEITDNKTVEDAEKKVKKTVKKTQEKVAETVA